MLSSAFVTSLRGLSFSPGSIDSRVAPHRGWSPWRLRNLLVTFPVPVAAGVFVKRSVASNTNVLVTTRREKFGRRQLAAFPIRTAVLPALQCVHVQIVGRFIEHHHVRRLRRSSPATASISPRRRGCTGERYAGGKKSLNSRSHGANGL
jgi:hypothetical protein